MNFSEILILRLDLVMIVLALLYEQAEQGIFIFAPLDFVCATFRSFWQPCAQKVTEV